MKKIGKNNLLFVIKTMIGISFLLSSVSGAAQKAWTVPATNKSMKNAKAGVKDTENIGKTLYNQHCKSCHGAKGLGDGPKAGGLDSKIRSFAAPAFQSQTDGEIYYKATIGRDEMPNFEKKITAVSDRWLLVNYLRTFKK